MTSDSGPKDPAGNAPTSTDFGFERVSESEKAGV